MGILAELSRSCYIFVTYIIIYWTVRVAKITIMGGKFGNLSKYKNVVSYSLSPFEQRAFAGFFSHGLANLYRRFRSQVFYVGPPLLIMLGIVNTASAMNHELSRKNPKDFEDDE